MTKFEKVTDLVQHISSELSQTPNWQSFLDSAANLYKYPFHEQLMIYAQNPTATVCAPIEVWNNQFGRFPKRGIGIALIDNDGENPQLKYVFET
ncbi:MAG: hypothetical protein LBD23_07505 [Oscillospiraceae bacterium]|nr:hypothetical protein [Oscillospiraceae bacterium]